MFENSCYIGKYTAPTVALVREMASNRMPFLVEMGLTNSLLLTLFGAR